MAGISTVALVDATLQPCAGFHAMFLLNEQYCADFNAQRLRYAESTQHRHVYRR